MVERTVWSIGFIDSTSGFHSAVKWCINNLQSMECKIFGSRISSQGVFLENGRKIVLVAVRADEVDTYLSFLSREFPTAEFKSHSVEKTGPVVFISCVGDFVTAPKIRQSLLGFE